MSTAPAHATLLHQPAPEVAGDELERRVQQQLADALVCANWASPIGAIALSFGLWCICYVVQHQAAALVWAGLIHASQVHRLIFTLRYARTPEHERHPLRSAPRYCNSLLLGSVIWGLAPWMFFPAPDASLVALMMLVLLGVSSGGLAGIATSRRAITSFIVPILAGLASALFWQGTLVYGFLGVATLIYLVANVKFGLKQHQLLADSLRGRYEKEALAQRLAVQMRRVEQLHDEKTRFLAAASHDLRQPLHSLGLFGAALSIRLEDTPEQALVSRLMQCVDALETSFRVMLDVSRIDAGVVQATARPVALAEVFRRLHASYAESAQAKDLALRLRPGGRWVFCDAALLERVLGNLIHNAIKFTARGGVVVVARQRGNQVSVQVWDTGCGISGAELPRVFEEFYQVGNSERDRAAGLGMGLAIVRRLTDLMGIPLQLSSLPGRGTCATLLLQAIAPEPGVTPLAAESPVPAFEMQGLRVMVVDDEDSVRQATQAALQGYGVEVTAAPSPEEALGLAQAQGQQLDAVIVDYRLRGNLDGVALVTLLREQAGRHLPALLVTGDTAPDRVRDAARSGLPVLYKPLEAGTLARALFTACREHRGASPQRSE